MVRIEGAQALPAALLALVLLAGGCRPRPTRASEVAPSSSAATPVAASAPPALASGTTAVETAAPGVAIPFPPPPEPTPDVPVKLIRAPRLSAPKGMTTLPLFECTHVKFAWGREFRGFVLDENGRVWLYDRGGWGWTPTRALGPNPSLSGIDSPWFERAALAAHFAPALSTARVATSSVREQSALSVEARLGELPPPKPEDIPLDSGDGEYCTSYRWDESRTVYQAIDSRGTAQ